MPLGSSLGTARSPWRFWWCWAAPCSSAAAAARAQAKGKAAYKRVRLPAEGDVAGGHRPQTGADAAVAGTACADVAAPPMRTMCYGSRSIGCEYSYCTVSRLPPVSFYRYRYP